MKLRCYRLLIPAVMLFVAAMTAFPQMTAERVLENMRTEYERGIQNIDDYTLVTSLYTAQYKKFMVDGRPVFKSRVQLSGAEQFSEDAVATSSMGHSEFFDEKVYNYLKQNARYEGTQTVDGVATHVLFVEDLEPITESDETDHPRNAYFFVDAEKWVVRKMEFEVDVEYDDTEKRTMQPVIRFLDYRSVEGMQVPYRTVMDMGEWDDTMSPEDREEARQSMAELQQQLDEMPEQQRKMMERMLRPQLEQLEKMLAGDRLEFVIEVEEVLVNMGLAENLFE
jgi:hypothetical protein